MYVPILIQDITKKIMNAPRFIQLIIVKRNVKKKPALRDIGDDAGIRKGILKKNKKNTQKNISFEFIYENITEE